MTRPHEDDGEWYVEIDGDSRVVVTSTSSDITAEARGRLCRQAREMARLLLDLEWAGSRHINEDPACPSCGSEHERDKATHAPDCALVAVLRAAGVLPGVVQIPNPDAPEETEPMYGDDEAS